ncbi:MAG TPA: Amuc_1100 family pilus-like protein [Candidatus Sulfopaludibacter sp.]|nr:Amuc_1100 family pilus-like protein [Candidatus Sulfopaludibacter sp.]
MAWIKRNLFFFIGAVIAVGLLAAAGVYDFQNWQRNNAALDALNQTYTTMQSLLRQNPSPGNDAVNNIEIAGAQAQQLREWIRQADQYFQPIVPIPNPTNGVVADAGFAAARDHTINQLQIEADNASVTLPPQYGFSFEAERTMVRFAPGSLGALAQQLGEVRALCEVLFAAKINSLDGVRRVPVSPDDAAGPQADYYNEPAVTNNLAVFMPYELTFRCFSQDLAVVLSSFASSPHGFIVKGINVQPAAGVATESSTPGGPPMGVPDQSAAPFGRPSPFGPRPFAPASPPSIGRGGLQTVLNEQLLSITLDVEIVKLQPGN